MNCKYACEMDIAVLDSQAYMSIDGSVIMLLECYILKRHNLSHKWVNKVEDNLSGITGQISFRLGL